MSGGSFEYLYGDHPIDASYMRRLKDMVEALRNRASYSDHSERLQEAADHLEAYLHRIECANRSLSVRHGTLKDLLKSVEWVESCDRGEGDIVEKVKELSGEEDSDE